MGRQATLFGLTLLAASASAPAAPPASVYRPATIIIGLSPKAAARIAAAHVPITVIAWFEGDPTDTHGDAADDTTGNIDLGEERISIRAAGPVVITGNRIPAARLGWIKPGSLNLTVNVVTGGVRNLIHCDPLIAGPARQFSGRRLAEQCRLIQE